MDKIFERWCAGEREFKRVEEKEARRRKRSEKKKKGGEKERRTKREEKMRQQWQAQGAMTMASAMAVACYIVRREHNRRRGSGERDWEKAHESESVEMGNVLAQFSVISKANIALELCTAQFSQVIWSSTQASHS